MSAAPRLIAGNWKMNGTIAETIELCEALRLGADRIDRKIELLVIPPFTALAEAARRLAPAGGRIAWGGQDLHWEPDGAFTGEISGPMLRELGCTHVLVGHSERRTLFGEAGETLLRKLRAALRHALVPILCVGESLEERESGATERVLDAQLDETSFALDPEEARRVVVAYEPVWAIGTGRTATPEQAEQAHRHIRARFEERFGSEPAGALRILYGGSVKPANARELLDRPGIDGALVGGASLRADAFLEIAVAAEGA
ncbi:MAG: triose-phosphate isomerase [Candidatus Eisenbacteria bacterium]|nr:triose-phosphate isomerase [Candidatus Latescibacterota bacterium]MBD3301402.1 triose-phosphate isomerase [Candidatus Eisenbacteria bacterium]